MTYMPLASWLLFLCVLLLLVLSVFVSRLLLFPLLFLPANLESYGPHFFLMPIKYFLMPGANIHFFVNLF